MKENLTLISSNGLTLERLEEIINQGFGSPYLVEGGVTASIQEEDGIKWLALSIGRRDVAFTEEGNIWSTGTFIGMEDDSLRREDYIEEIL